MRLPPVELSEWRPADYVELTAEDALALRNGPGEFSVELQAHGYYRVTPSHWVGIVELSERDVIVRPKVGVSRLFELLGYSSRLRFSDSVVGLLQIDDIAEVLIRAFLHQTQAALRLGPLRSYRSVDDVLPSVRGRVRLLEQGRRRFFMPLPVEVRYDDFTTDIEENRLIKAALRRVARMKLRDEKLRSRAHIQVQVLEGVADVRYGSQNLPRPSISRLNRHYEHALDLGRTILQATSADLATGNLQTPSFLVDMNVVFEEFIYAKLGEHLRVRPPLRWQHEKRVKFDELQRITMKPDLSLWEGPDCIFVGDAKYKMTDVGVESDLYQAFSYAKALGLKGAMLIYASVGEGQATHTVRRDGAALQLRELDLAAPESDLEVQIAELAAEVRLMAGLPEHATPSAAL